MADTTVYEDPQKTYRFLQILQYISGASKS